MFLCQNDKSRTISCWGVAAEALEAIMWCDATSRELYSPQKQQNMLKDVFASPGWSVQTCSRASVFSVWSEWPPSWLKLIKDSPGKCECRRSSVLFLHEGSVLSLIIHSAHVEMSAAALWSAARPSLAEPSVSPGSVGVHSHTRMAHTFPHTSRMDGHFHSFFCFSFLKFHPHSDTAVIISHRNSWVEHGAGWTCQQMGNFQKDCFLLPSWDVKGTSGFSLSDFLLSAVCQQSFNKKPSAVPGQLRLIPVVQQASAQRC